MPRIRIIRKWGNSMVIILSSSDVKDFQLKPFDEVDLENAVFKKGTRRDKKEK